MYEYPLIPNTLMYLHYSYYNTFEEFKQSILPFRHKSEEFFVRNLYSMNLL